ncbi:alpha/beta fold hydrolase [Zobellella sp. DQSA1]|uniref:alpha/beta fold hydrolase n=1 Tax=Zobellella sp. DQSA1 TaxID=3342386 RepID=UPI0035BF90DA
MRNSPGRFVLVGFSLGGYIARQLAADYSERVSALAVIASSLREDTQQQAKSKMQAVQALSPATFNGLSAGAIARSLHPRHSSDASLIARIKAMGNRLGYGAQAVQSALRGADVPADSISCPTLVVASPHDTLRSIEEANELVRAIPDASLQLFDDGGHMIPLEQPRELAAAVVSWLEGLGIY